MIVRIDIGAMQEVITGFYTMIQRAIRLKEDLLDCYDRIQTNASNPVPPVSMSAIDEAIEWAYRQIPIMERRLSLAILVATANGHVFPDNGEVKPGSHVVSIDMEKDLAAILPDLVAAAKGGNLSDEQWQTLLDIANIAPADPEVPGDDQRYANQDAMRQWLGANLFNGLTPEDAAELADRLGNFYIDPQASYNSYLASNPDGPVSFEQWFADRKSDYESRVTALGELLGAASRSVFPELSDQFKQQTIDLLTNPDTPLDISVGMSLILSEGTYDSQFASDIVNAVIGWESGLAHLPSTNDTPDRDSPRDFQGNIRHDVMVGLMDMLDNNHGASQLIFTSGGTTPIAVGEQSFDVNFNLDYLVNRDWDGPGNPGSDVGTALGRALETATTEQRNHDTTGQLSATITTHLIAAAGQNQQTAEDMAGGLKESMALILANYMPDIFRVGGKGDSSDDISSASYYTGSMDGFPSDMPPGALMDRDALTNLFRSLGQGEDAKQNTRSLVEGWGAADQYTSNYYLSQYGGQGANWGNLALWNASVLKFIIDGAVDGAAGEGSNGDLLNTMTSVAIKTAGQVPSLKVGTTAAGIAQQLWTDVISGLVDQDDNQSVILLNQEQAIDAATANWLQAMANQGVLPTEAIDEGKRLNVITDNGDGTYSIDASHPNYDSWTLGPYYLPYAEISGAITTGLR